MSPRLGGVDVLTVVVGFERGRDRDPEVFDQLFYVGIQLAADPAWQFDRVRAVRVLSDMEAAF